MTAAERILLAHVTSDDKPRRAEDWNDWNVMVDRMRRAIGARHDGHPKRPAPRRAHVCACCPDGMQVRNYGEAVPRRSSLPWTDLFAATRYDYILANPQVSR